MDKQLVINRRSQRMPEMMLEAPSPDKLSAARDILLKDFHNVFADPVDVPSGAPFGSGSILIMHFKDSNMTFDEAKALSEKLDQCLIDAGLPSLKIDNYIRESPPVYRSRFIFT